MHDPIDITDGLGGARMDTRLLETFAVLARTGNFTAAAAELHVAQSTVTAQVKALEKMLGVRLFDRLPTGAVLTSAGARLLERARAVLDAEARLRYEAKDASAAEGTVTIGASESLCAYRLPLALAALGRELPAVQLKMMPVVTPAAAAEQLTAGRIDLALLLEEHVDVPQVEAVSVGDEPLVLLASGTHPRLSPGSAWPLLREEPFFLLEEGCSYSDSLARRLSDELTAAPRVTRFGSIEAVRACVRAGLGVALLPRVSAEDDLASGRLLVVRDFPPVPVQLLRHRSRWLPPAAETVMARLRTLAADWA
ncbi:LysR family transcriptional regulator [Kitasatospora sp. NPDC048540]